MQKLAVLIMFRNLTIDRCFVVNVTDIAMAKITKRESTGWQHQMAALWHNIHPLGVHKMSALWHNMHALGVTTEATATLVSAFILSRLDYCNSLLSGCPRSLILRLQKVQNNAARLILRISKREHISPHLASLHWLPIDSRIKYKLACICYNSLSTNSPPYLSDLLTVYTASHQLRSCSDNSVLRRPSVRTVSYGQRSFAYSAPSAWNALPQQVRSSDSVSTFRSRTKTHLFRLAY